MKYAGLFSGKALILTGSVTTVYVKKQFHCMFFPVISHSKMQTRNVLKNLKVAVFTLNEDTSITC